MIQQLEFMRDNYRWIKNDPHYVDQVEDIISQLTYEYDNSRELLHEQFVDYNDGWEIQEFITEDGKFKTRMRKVENHCIVARDHEIKSLW